MADFLEFIGDIAFPTAMAKMRQRRAGEQVKQLLGQPGQQYQPGVSPAPMKPIAPTGLLGGQITPQQFGAELLAVPGYEQMGAQFMERYGPQAPTKPTPQIQNLMAMGLQEGTPEFAAAMERLIMPKTATGTEGLLGAKAPMWVDPTGKPASPMMTMAQATQQGFEPKTAEQLKGIQATQQFAPMLGKAIEYGFGGTYQTDGQEVKVPSLFPEEVGLTSGLRALWETGQAAAGYEPQLASYQSTTDSMLSNLARMTGQVGALTDEDVKRVQSMLPKPYQTTEAEARQKFKDIASLLMSKGVSKAMMMQAGIPQWAIGGKGKDLPRPMPEFGGTVVNIQQPAIPSLQRIAGQSGRTSGGRNATSAPWERKW